MRLDALCCVDQQDRAFACGKRPGHLIREVDVPGGVDQVQDVIRAIAGMERQPHRLRLDRDATLALDVHAIEVLGTHLARVDDSGDLQHAIGQGRLAVVDMGDDAEIPDQLGAGVSGGRLGHCVLV